jgi:voltage-gated potassium channel
MHPLIEVRHALLWLRSLTREASRKRALKFLLVLTGAAVVSSGLLLYVIDPGITSAWSGMWFAWATLTHVGFGDIVPASLLGKVLSSVLILLGVGFFAVVTGLFAAVLVTHDMRGIEREIGTVERDVTELKSAETHILIQLQAIERRLTAIEARLNETRPIDQAGQQP